MSRKGLDATVTIEPTRVHVELHLGLLLTAMAPAIKAGLVKELTGLLTSGNGSAA